jgi:hypothetical protein
MEPREEDDAAAPRRRSGARTGSQKLDEGKDDAVDIYLTDEILFPRPATPTPSPHREHHLGHPVLFPPPWPLSCVGPAMLRRVAR